MTRIWNPYTFTPLGNPIVGEAPPVLRVMGGMQATAQQLAYAQQRFTQFVMQARLSVVPNPTEAGRLPDGTQYRIVVVGPQTVMEIWPQPQGGDGAFIAWTAFFDTAHFPIWERPVVDFPYDDLPPKPEPPGPEPQYPALAESYSVWETEGQEVAAPVVIHVIYRLYIGWRVLGSGDALTPVLTGFRKSTRLDEVSGYFLNEYENAPVSAGFAWTITTRNFSTGLTPSGDDGGYADFPTLESGEVVVYPSYTNYTGQTTAAQAAASAYNASVIASYEAAHAAWEAANSQYLIDLAEWNALRDELIALNRPWLPVLGFRNAARPVQVENVKAHLLSGIGDRHLTARILSFPYNVAYRSVPAVGAGGAITHEWAVEETQRGYKTTLTDAEPHTVWPIFEPASADTYPAHLLRRDFMPPECLFGWKASGEVRSVDRFYAEQRAAENLMVAPPGFSGLSVSYPADYFSYTRMKPDAAPGLVVASDAFVPQGSTFTIVFFEYLTLDPRGGEEHWVICPELMQRDSIWIREGGTYVDTPRFVDNLFTQRVRLAGAVTQTRTGKTTWSAPKVTPRAALVQGSWEAAFVCAVPEATPCRAPSAVVIASGMNAAANPGRQQSGGFYLDASHLWSGAPDPVRAARARPWDSNAATAPQEQFITRALIAAGRIKP